MSKSKNDYVDEGPWVRFTESKFRIGSDEDRDRVLAANGYNSIEEFIEACKRSREIIYDPEKEEKLEEEQELTEKIEKDLFGDDLQKSAQPLEEWADENMCKNIIKADVPLFVRALMAVQHWVFDLLSPEQSEKVYTSLINRMLQDKWSLSDLVKEVQSVDADIPDTQAKAIARSESTLIVNKSREITFENNAPGEYGYSWGGPSDHRTTEICTNIKARIPKNGVDTLEELKAIVKEEAQKYYAAHGLNTVVREWLPHPNCRHYIRSIWRG